MHGRPSIQIQLFVLFDAQDPSYTAYYGFSRGVLEFQLGGLVCVSCGLH